LSTGGDQIRFPEYCGASLVRFLLIPCIIKGFGTIGLTSVGMRP